MFRLSINNYFKFVNVWLNNNFSVNPFSRLYGFARSMLALATLTIFLFNSPNYIFDEFILDKLRESSTLVSKFNLFLIFQWQDLIFAQVIASTILIAVIIGWYPWVTCILHWWVALSLQTSGLILDGGDQINAILTGFLIPIALLDKRKNHWHSTKKNVSFHRKIIAHFCFLTISIQMSYLYLNAAMEKAYGTSQWANGTALYYIFNNPLFGLKELDNNIFHEILKTQWVIILTWAIIVLELIISYFLFARRDNRWMAFLLGGLFHLQIACTFGLISFGLSMLAGLSLYALPFNVFEKLLEKWGGYKSKITQWIT